MRFEKAEQIFREKYPNGKIFKHPNKNNIMCIKYDNRSKIYDYHYNSYKELLNKLFPDKKFMYSDQANIHKEKINQLKKWIDSGYREDWTGRYKIEDQELKGYKEKLNHLQNRLEQAIII